MKQTNTTAAAFDLDDLERELRQAAAPRKAPLSDDPLAELARLVGPDARAARKAGDEPRVSFDDILAAKPQPVSGAMPHATPRIEPLFPEGLPAVRDGGHAADKGFDVSGAPVPAAHARAPDPLEALLSQDLGLRSGLDELPAVPPPPVKALPADGLPHATFEVPALPDAPAPADPSFAAVPLAEASPAPGEVPAAGGGASAQFDDMLAEFEAAMRDVAVDAVQPQSPAAAADPVMQAPPGDIVVPEYAVPPPPVVAPPLPYAAEPEALEPGAAAAGAAAGAAGVLAQATRPRRGMLLAGGVIAVAVIGLGGLTLFGGSGSRVPGSGSAPVIAANPGITKERPANPGGVEVPNQDKEILQPRSTTAQQAERVAPREEQPVDLTQAQRQAAAGQSQNPSAVRQIPGVSIVAPVSTTPPAGAQAPQSAEPQPRPVASVPITIAGQPTPSISPPTLTPPALTPPAASQSNAPPASAATGQPPVAAATPPSVAPASPAAQRQPAAAQPGQPATEPRRVRSVPIRPEAGEAAPARAQSQPRVVAAAPAAAGGDAANGPLRITPGNNRPAASAAPVQAAPAPVAAAPAARPAAPAVQPGSVPSSVPSLDNDQPTATAPTRAASAAPAPSAGSGFSVQLAAEGSEEAARARFERMRGQYGAVLGGASPSIRSADVNGRAVYRIRVGNMSREEAVSMCERLKASGGSCFVARN